jgi:superfamily I DNA/RNA helicase
MENVPARKLTICTFHALCVRILRQDIDRLGYKTNFSIYDENDQLGLLRRIVPRLAPREQKLDPHLARLYGSPVPIENSEEPVKFACGSRVLPATPLHSGHKTGQFGVDSEL